MPPGSGVVTIENVVFSPRNLEALLAAHRAPTVYRRDMTVTAADRHVVAASLRTCDL